MLPTLIMALMHVFAVGGIYYFINRAGKEEIPFDLVIGFFTVSLLFVLALNWYAGWPDYIDAAYLTVTNYYMAGFVGLVAVIMGAVYIVYVYKFLFKESADVTV